MRIGRLAMGLVYVAAGLAHFAFTRSYVRIMPDYLPAHRELVLVSGAAELAGGVGVLLSHRYPRVGRLAAWGIVLLLIAVMPANIWMVQHPERFPNVPLWASWVRLPLQLPLIWWAWQYTRRRDQRPQLEA